MRLIDADALTDFLKCLLPARGMWEIDGDTAKNAVCETVADAIEMVKNMETIKPERRKRGHWEPVTNGRGGHQCDRCGCYAPSYQSGTEWLSDFCPNCGAKMEVEHEAYDKGT